MPDTQVKLLIVDDDHLLRGVLAAIFKQVGLSVRTAEDGFSALEQMRAEMPDILLSDLNMPGMSGFELLSVVRSRMPAVHTIAMSGALSGDGVQAGVAADGFYEKGERLGVLLELVRVGGEAQEAMVARGGTPAPLWISVDGHDAEGAYTILACPECLRTFAQSVEPRWVNLIQKTQCAHCHRPIEYAILQPGDPSVPQDFQRKPSGAVGGRRASVVA